jgi:hypothetical protein
MRACPIVITVVAACGGGAARPAAGPGAEPTAAAAPAEVPEEDARLVHLRTMTDTLALLAADVERITSAGPPSQARCADLADALAAWGAAHYEAYEVADAEGSFLGLTDADAGNPELVGLARQLARTSSLLVEEVDEDCLYGSGAYGAALFEYLVAYQGLAHWVREGDPATWDYEALIGDG